MHVQYMHEHSTGVAFALLQHAVTVSQCSYSASVAVLSGLRLQINGTVNAHLRA
jgi:hypothetical protein